jgi:hypothetical protein
MNARAQLAMMYQRHDQFHRPPQPTKTISHRSQDLQPQLNSGGLKPPAPPQITPVSIPAALHAHQALGDDWPSDALLAVTERSAQSPRSPSIRMST